MDQQVTGEVTRFFERKKIEAWWLHPYLEDSGVIVLHTVQVLYDFKSEGKCRFFKLLIKFFLYHLLRWRLAWWTALVSWPSGWSRTRRDRPACWRRSASPSWTVSSPAWPPPPWLSSPASPPSRSSTLSRVRCWPGSSSCTAFPNRQTRTKCSTCHHAEAFDICHVV